MEENFLTPLEVKRLQMLIKHGGNLKKAAEASCVSVHTFKNELAWIRAKLGARTTLEAVIWAFQKGVVQ